MPALYTPVYFYDINKKLKLSSFIFRLPKSLSLAPLILKKTDIAIDRDFYL